MGLDRARKHHALLIRHLPYRQMSTVSILLGAEAFLLSRLSAELLGVAIVGEYCFRCRCMVNVMRLEDLKSPYLLLFTTAANQRIAM